MTDRPDLHSAAPGAYDQPVNEQRRALVRAAAGAAGAVALSAFGASPARGLPSDSEPSDLMPAGQLSSIVQDHQSFDPWIEIDRAAFQHNVREASRLAGGRPIIAVVKNNAYGLGDAVVGPLLADCKEVSGLACVRVAEAVSLREAGVKKPILNMAEVSEQETEVLVRHGVTSSVWLDDAPERMARIAKRLGKPVPLELCMDVGMGREGMPDYRGQAWLETLCRQSSVRVEGTYMMFAHHMPFAPEQLGRFMTLVQAAQTKGLQLGRLHASPTFELFLYPDAHLDAVRPGNALFGNYPSAPGVKDQAKLKSVFRLKARISRLEQLRPGDSASFRREYVATKPTWVAMLPIGHTDGYPGTAANTCKVLIGGRLYPVVSVVASAHTIIEIGDEKTVNVGDVATLIGPDHPEIDPQYIAEKTGVRFLLLITKFNARLPRYVV